MTFGTTFLTLVFCVLLAVAVTVWLRPRWVVLLSLALAMAISLGGIVGIAVCVAAIASVAAALWLWSPETPGLTQPAMRSSSRDRPGFRPILQLVILLRVDARVACTATRVRCGRYAAFCPGGSVRRLPPTAAWRFPCSRECMERAHEPYLHYRDVRLPERWLLRASRHRRAPMVIAPSPASPTVMRMSISSHMRQP